MSRVWTKAAGMMLLMTSLAGAWGKDTLRERIYRKVISGLESRGAESGPLIAAEALDLGGAARLPEEAQFDLASVRWDALLGRWEFQLRCINPQQCVPFLVTAKAEKGPMAGAGRDQVVPTAVRAGGTARLGGEKRLGTPDVEAGQNARVSWSEAGLAMTAEVVCLERGVEGQWIRVRAREGRGRVFRARVAGMGRLVAGPGEAP